MPVGAFVLSFDFELAWGVRRSSRVDSHSPNIARTQELIPRLLQTLAEHKISATWATVGHLLLSPAECPGGRFPYPAEAPEFPWFDGRWYDGIPTCDEPDAAAYYAPESVRAILACPVYQELAAHTFSHVSLGEAACTPTIARRELELCQQLAARQGRRLSSLVFPRNEIGNLDALIDTGYRCYRGANSEWYWFGHPTALYRCRACRYAVWLLRYLDEMLCLRPALPLVRRQAGLWEIPHSMFFPGRSGVSRWITPAQRVRRAIRGLQRASQLGRVFSMWTHPSTFLSAPEPLLGALAEICAEAARLRSAAGLEVLTMGQVAERLDDGQNLHWALGPDELPAAIKGCAGAPS